jgi:hypothetical protein
MKSILTYGNGICEIESNEKIAGVEIFYKGRLNIIDKTPTNFNIIANDNKILIFKLGDGELSSLFEYTGEFIIIKAIIANDLAQKVPVFIKEVFDYADMITTNAEDMTINSEKLKSTYTSRKKVTKTTISSKNKKKLDLKNINEVNYE